MTDAYETIKLDGRTFHGVIQAMTAAQDDFIQVVLRKADATEKLRALANPAIEADARRKILNDILADLMEAGKAKVLLAGLLTEEGKTWNREEARRNAARFDAITDTEEKIAMHKEIVKYLFGFFLLGEASRETSPNSLNPNEKAPDITNAAQENLASSVS